MLHCSHITQNDNTIQTVAPLFIFRVVTRFFGPIQSVLG